MATLYVLVHTLLYGGDAAGLLVAAPASGSFALLALVAVGAALAWVAVRGYAAGPLPDGETTGRGLAMLRRAERTGPMSLCDPDAPGRPRPRAPGAAPAAA